jgi:hypothetical protein
VGSEHHRVRFHLPDGSTGELLVREDQHIWDAAHAAGIEPPSICHQGRCLTCAGRLLEPGDFDASNAVSCFPEDRAAGFIFYASFSRVPIWKSERINSLLCASTGEPLACRLHILG